MPKTATHSAKRALIVTTASLAWFALLLQLLLTIRTSLSNGMSIIAAIAMYFSFFTITTNLLVALVLTFSLLATKFPLGQILLQSRNNDRNRPLHCNRRHHLFAPVAPYLESRRPQQAYGPHPA